jgi:hypothetical protein
MNRACFQQFNSGLVLLAALIKDLIEETLLPPFTGPLKNLFFSYRDAKALAEKKAKKEAKDAPQANGTKK